MSIDNTDSTATVESNTSTASEAVQTAPAQADAQPADTSTAVSEDQSSDPGHISGIPDNGSDASLTPPDTVVPQSTPQPPTADEVAKYKAEIDTYKRRLAGQSRTINEHGEKLKRYDGIDPNEIRQFREQQEVKKREALHKWNANHPAHSQFQESRRRVQDYRQALAKAETPEAREVVKNTMGSLLNEQEVNDVISWETHQRGVQEQFSADPEGFIQQRVQDQIAKAMEQKFQEVQQKAAAEANVGKWFEDPANKPIVEKLRAPMAEMLERLGGTDDAWAFTQAMAQREFENQQLKAQLDALRNHDKEADRHVASADERTRLLQNRAAITRDSTVKRSTDPMKLAKDRGIRPGTPAYLDLLRELSSQGNLQ